MSGNQKINDVIDYAVNNIHCDFYRNLYAHMNLDIEDIAAIEDIKTVPTITKKDINNYKEKYPFLFIDEKEVVSCEVTSGTSSDALMFYSSAKDDEIGTEKRRFLIRHENPMPDNRILLVRAPNIADKHAKAYRSLGYTVVKGDIYNLGLAVEIAIAMKINAISSSPTITLKLGEMLKKRNYDMASIRFLAMGSELISGIAQKEFHRLFPSSRIMRRYALLEAGILGYQCKDIEGTENYHPLDKYHIYEIININTGKLCSPGEIGELVITNLWTGSATPLIRYRTGDIAIFSEDTCRCGKKTFRILGRAGFDRIRIGGITLFNENFEKALSPLAAFISDYQVHLFEKNKRGRIMPGIVIECTLKKGIKRSDMLKRNIKERLMSNFEIARDYTWKKAVEKNIFLPIEIRFVAEIIHEGCKALRIIDHRSVK